MPSATSRGSRPASPASAMAQSALVTLNSPVSGTRAPKRSCAGVTTVKVEPSGSRTTSSARQSAGCPDGREGRHRHGRLVEQTAAERVVDVGQPATGPLGREQRGLGGEVVLHVLVEVEVVAAEVEEGRHVEDDPRHPAHHERVAGHLHRARGHALLDHRSEQRVQVGRLGSGERGLHVPAGHPGADRADHRSTHTGCREAALEEAGRRRLALGAGDGHQGEGARRLAVQQRGEPPEHRARVVQHQHGRGGLADHARAGLVGEDRDGTRRPRPRRRTSRRGSGCRAAPRRCHPDGPAGSSATARSPRPRRRPRAGGPHRSTPSPGREECVPGRPDG